MRKDLRAVVAVAVVSVSVGVSGGGSGGVLRGRLRDVSVLFVYFVGF